jgi:hypothetical protein
MRTEAGSTGGEGRGREGGAEGLRGEDTYAHEQARSYQGRDWREEEVGDDNDWLFGGGGGRGVGRRQGFSGGSWHTSY